jgi:hypothetical protein
MILPPTELEGNAIRFALYIFRKRLIAQEGVVVKGGSKAVSWRLEVGGKVE